MREQKRYFEIAGQHWSEYQILEETTGCMTGIETLSLLSRRPFDRRSSQTCALLNAAHNRQEKHFFSPAPNFDPPAKSAAAFFIAAASCFCLSLKACLFMMHSEGAKVHYRHNRDVATYLTLSSSSSSFVSFLACLSGFSFLFVNTKARGI